MSQWKQKPSFLGFGLGLRKEHYQEILQTQVKLDWLEVITENYLSRGGKPHYYLECIRQRYPIVMHGVSLSIGSTDPLNMPYLKQVKQLSDQIQPKWISDHLCWNGVNRQNSHDLLPLPYTQEAIKHVSLKIKKVQDFLQSQILLENISSYVSYSSSSMPEWAFLAEVVTKADCLILLDINNVFVNSYNFHFDPITYLQNIPKERVQQFHLAGHRYAQNCIIDTHDKRIVNSVWDLYKIACQIFGPVSTCIERDDNIPPLNELIEELEQAKTIFESLKPI